MIPASTEAIRAATVSICFESGGHIGQGLLLEDADGGSVVLTCHHVATAVPGHKLHVAIPDQDGSLTAPLRATYDHRRSRPESDVALIRIDVEAPERLLLHTLDPDRYDGGLEHPVTGFTYLTPWTFDARLGTATPLRCVAPELARADVPGGTYEVRRAFRLIEPTDTREGISGAPVVGGGGVLGLAHFARDEKTRGRPEAYMIPLEEWAVAWPQLAESIAPFTDGSLRSAARIKQANELAVGVASRENGDPDLTIAGYQPQVYVPHPAAERAARSLEQFDEVVVIGRPMSGKTRLVNELLKATPEATVVMPEGPVPPGRIELSGFASAEIVLLCEDIHLGVERINPLLWRRRLAESGARVRVILSCRDGGDWRRAREADSALADRFREAVVPLSAEGARGSDFPVDESRQLASLLGLSEDALNERFDGTPGSLTLDLPAMRDRYERLRDEQVHGVPTSRMLDSIKLLHHCGQSPVRQVRVRQVAETVRGESRVSEEGWEALQRRTAEAGFGVFVDEVFSGYPPLIERCVEYDPDERDCSALSELLCQEQAWLEALALARSPRVPPQVRERTLNHVIARAEGDPTAAARLHLALLQADQDRSAEALENLIDVITGEDPGRAAEATLTLGWLYEEWGSAEDAVAALESVVDSGHNIFTPEAAARLGLLQAQEGQIDAAASAYRIAVESGTSEAAGVAAYNLVSLQAGLESEEELHLLQVAFDSGHEEASPAAAVRLASRQTDPAETAAFLESAIGSSNQDVAHVAAVQLGVTYLEANDVESAKRVLYPVVEIPEADMRPTAAWVLGSALSLQGDPDEAIRLLQIARTGKNKTMALDAGARIGELLALRQDFDGAAAVFDETMAAPEGLSEWAKLNFGIVELKRGNPEESRHLLRPLVRSEDEYVRRRAGVAIAILDASQKPDEKAIAQLQSFVVNSDADVAVDSALCLGQIYRQAGRLEDAALVLRPISTMEAEGAPRAKTELGEIELARDNHEVGQKLLAEVIEDFGNDPGFEEEVCVAALCLGTALQSSDEAEAAVEPLRIAARAGWARARREARMRLGVALCDSGAVREGLGVLQDIVDAGGDDAALAAHYIGLVLAEDEDWIGASEVWGRVVEFEGSELRARALKFLGSAYLNIGRTDAAIETLERAARSSDPEVAPMAAAQLASVLLDQDRPERAAELLRAAIGDHSSSAAREASVTLGIVEKTRGNTEESTLLWEAALQDPLDQAAAVAIGNLALSRAQDGDAEGADEMLERLSGSAHQDLFFTVAKSLSEVCFEEDEERRGRSILRRIAESGSPAYSAWAGWELGLRLLDANEPLEALEVLRVAIDARQAGYSEAAALLSGRLSQLQGKVEAATRLFEVASRSTDSALASPASLALGEALVEQGEEERAQGHLRIAIELGDAEIKAGGLKAMAELRQAEGMTEEARALWAQAMACGHSEPAAHAAFVLGSEKVEAGDFRSAREALETAAGSGFDLVATMASLNLVVLDALEGNRDAAKEQALALASDLDGPLSAKAWLTYAGLCHEGDDLGGCQRGLEAAVAVEDGLYAPEAAIQLASLHLRNGSSEAAASAFLEGADAADEDFVPTGFQLALNLAKSEDWAAAELVLARVEKAAAPELLPFVSFTHGRFLLELQRNDEAVKAFELAMQDGDTEFGVRAALELGKIRQLEDRTADAQRLLETVIASGLDDCLPEATFYLGLIEYEVGDLTKAKRHWELAVKSEDPQIVPVATLNLAVLHHRQDRLEMAVELWQGLVDSGHPHYGPEAEKMLRIASEEGQ